jgi:hypothetical protein
MLALILAAVLPLTPDQAVPPTSSATTPAAILVPGSFAKLFTLKDLAPPDGKTVVVVPPSTPRVQRKVVCGTTLLIVDGRVDPKMAVAPTGKDVDPRMPRVPKPMCGEQQK